MEFIVHMQFYYLSDQRHVQCVSPPPWSIYLYFITEPRAKIEVLNYRVPIICDPW